MSGAAPTALPECEWAGRGVVLDPTVSVSRFHKTAGLRANAQSKTQHRSHCWDSGQAPSSPWGPPGCGDTVRPLGGRRL